MSVVTKRILLVLVAGSLALSRPLMAASAAVPPPPPPDASLMPPAASPQNQSQNPIAAAPASPIRQGSGIGSQPSAMLVPPIPAPSSPSSAGPGTSLPLRDPTSPSPTLRDLVDPARGVAKSVELPSIQLKGRIVGGQQPNAAMLEIDKRSYLVRRGSEILFPGARTGVQSVRVLDVTADEVRIEISPLGRSLSLN